ncbi:preprotein translocase subunit SecA [Paenibacillus thiaminolyticus]|nr:preprotein translocase subunit SecA [Paenibacillus thiaminolyticus]
MAEGRNTARRLMLNRYADVLEQQRRIIAVWRRDVLMEETPPLLKLAEDAARHKRLCRRWGAERARRLEKRVTLRHIDQRWSDYVEYVSAVREGLHLEGLSRQDPLDLYHQRLIGAQAGERECLRPYRCRRCGLLALLSCTPALGNARLRVRLAFAYPCIRERPHSCTSCIRVPCIREGPPSCTSCIRVPLHSGTPAFVYVLHSRIPAFVSPFPRHHLLLLVHSFTRTFILS